MIYDNFVNRKNRKGITYEYDGTDNISLAASLACCLRQADSLHTDSEAIYENGYCFRVAERVDDSEV